MRFAMGCAAWIAAQAGPAESPRLVLLASAGMDGATARKAFERWSAFRGPKRVFVVTLDPSNLERDLLKWLDAVPRGVEPAPLDPEAIDWLRRYGVRRLPCFLRLDRGRVHRAYGIPKEIERCPR
jgi:hypothetical protein